MKGYESHPLQVAAPSGTDRPGGRTRWLVRAIYVAFAAALLVFVGGFGLFAAHVSALSTPDDPRPAEAIIVVTGGTSRIDAGMDLLRAGKGERLLISGVNPSTRIEDLRRVTNAEGNLFDCCVDIDHAALDTIGNAEESAKWVLEHSFRSAILVTNNYHMPRSLLEMRRYLGDVELQPYPVVHRKLENGEWLQDPAAARLLFTEYMKYLAAFARGLVRGGDLRLHVAALQASLTSAEGATR